MTNQKAIAELEELVIKQSRIGLFTEEVEAIQHAIEVLKRFDRAVEVTLALDQDFDIPVLHDIDEPYDEIEANNILAIPKKLK